MKFCVDCKWHRLSNNLTHICINPKIPTETDAVTGEVKSAYGAFCSPLRIGSQNCGIEATWFEEKEQGVKVTEA